VEFSDGQRLDERRSHLGRDDVLAVRLAVVGSELRQELVVGDTGRRVETGLSRQLYRVGSSPECRERLVRLLYGTGEKADAEDLLRRMIDDPAATTNWFSQPIFTRGNSAAVGPDHAPSCFVPGSR
jgi:hypothetical protein